MRHLSTAEEFIEKAMNVHGDKYDYSKVEYVNSKTPVCIICPEHGEFWQSPNSHLSGCGCQACAGCKRMDTVSFIERARCLHGDKFDYTKVEYNGYHKFIRITCPEHGEFEMTPCGHLHSKEGCPKCSSQTNYAESFIHKAKEVHGGKYDYSQVVYSNAQSKVCIVCPQHGEFWMTPTSHLSGCGCVECYYDKIRSDGKLDFLKKSLELYGDAYDYSQVDYLNKVTPVKVSCKKHGLFMVSPEKHLRGCGCPECLVDVSTKDFIEKAVEVHGEKYDYSRVRVDGKRKVRVVCPEHGEFMVSVSAHLQGSGCPVCRKAENRKECVQKIKNQSLSGVYGVCDILGGKSSFPILYRKWRSMIRRCYSEYSQENSPSYSGCRVCDEWLLFSNFKKWYDDNWNGDSKMHLDKDLLVSGNKVYGPGTCCFIPQTLNTLISGPFGLKEDGLPYGIGSEKLKNGSVVYVINSKKYHDYKHYKTMNDAFCAYKSIRENDIHKKADEYYKSGVINDKVYQVLLSWELPIE